MELLKSNCKLKKQVSRFVIVDRSDIPFESLLFCVIIGKLFYNEDNNEKNFEYHINLHSKYMFTRKIVKSPSDNIIFTKNSIKSFLNFLSSSNTYFESTDLNTNYFICAEKIHPNNNINKLYIIMKDGNSINMVIFENKKELES